jgi:UDP-N-acetylglucosamine:LPS N-acetylglucosamine transferase
LVADSKKRAALSENIKKMADRDADICIAEEVLKLAER